MYIYILSYVYIHIYIYRCVNIFKFMDSNSLLVKLTQTLPRSRVASNSIAHSTLKIARDVILFETVSALD